MSTTARKLIKELGDKQMASEKLSSTENNDCVVRAVQHTFGVDYVDAHHFCEVKLMREPQDGVYTSMYLPKVKQAFGLKIKQLGKNHHMVIIENLPALKNLRLNVGVMQSKNGLGSVW